MYLENLIVLFICCFFFFGVEVCLASINPIYKNRGSRNMRRIATRKGKTLRNIFIFSLVYYVRFKYEMARGLYRDFLRISASSNVRERWQINNDMLLNECHTKLDSIK